MDTNSLLSAGVLGGPETAPTRSFSMIPAYKLGITSYQIPQPLLPNVKLFAPLVDDIELVLFESQELSNFPSAEEIEELRVIQEETDCTFTVHCPIDKKAVSPDKQEREFYITQVCTLMKLFSSCTVAGYVVHLEGLDRHAQDKDHFRWEKYALQFGKNITESGLCKPEDVCIETLGYPPEWNIPVVNECGFSHCLDIGHLWMYGYDWKSFCKQTIEKTKIIHLHGVNQGKDHKSLKMGDQQALQAFHDMVLTTYRNVVTLEVFSQQETFESIKILRKLWQK